MDRALGIIGIGKPWIVFVIIFFLFFIFIFPAQAEEIEARETAEESFPRYAFKTLPKNLLLGTKESLRVWNLAVLGVGAGTAITLSQTDADNEIQGGADDSIGDFAKIGDIGGNVFTLAGVAVSTYIIGRVSKNKKVIETGKALIEAQVITVVMTSMIKVSTGRERPDGSGTRFTSSFPSGHASGSFALASTVDAMYGYKTGIPLYMFAGFVGFSRLSDSKHFLSDVLFGAALGTVVGRGIGRIHKKEKGNDSELSILPYSDGSSTGLILTLPW